MKKIMFLIAFLFTTYSIRAQLASVNKQFSLTGKISGQKEGIVSLSYINSKGMRVKDTCALQDGNFYFEGIIIEPTLAYLRGDVKSIADNDPNATSLFIESGSMTVIAEKNHFKEIKVTGSKSQVESEILQKKYNAINNETDSAYEKISKINQQFVAHHPDSYVSSFQLALYQSRWPPDLVRQLYDKFNPAIQRSFYGKEIAESINKIDDNSAGKTAKPIIAYDMNGKLISLSDFKDKYVLLDFWASWCVPCRQGSPHLINLFKKYHSQGLEIIGIADDTDPNAWKKAIEKDGINIWYNILDETKTDMNGSINESQSINSKYAIQVLPTKILIGKIGMIIGRYKGTESEMILDNKLKEIFN